MNVSATNCNGNKYIENASSGTVNYTGNVIGIGSGGGSGTAGILNSSSGTVNIVGNVTGVSSGNGDSPAVRCTGSGAVNITGNVYGTPTLVVGSAVTAINISAGTLTVTGNLVAGAAAVNGCCILCSSTTGSVVINGDVTAAAAVAIASSTPYIAIPLTVYGNLIASSNGVTPVAFPKTLIHATTAMYQTYRINTAGVAGVARSLYTGGVNLGQPATGDVRLGTAYGAASEYTGTLAVPSPTLVAIGVATDDTVGSYAPTGGLDAAGVRSAIGLASANLDTQLSGLQSDTNDIQSRLPAALVGGKMDSIAELDSASRLAIWNTLTTETFTADSFGDLLIISDGTNGREVKVTGANHIAADVHDVQPDGLTASTDIIAIKAKTTNLPTDPADQSLVEAAITAATSPLATPAQVNAQVLDVLSVDTFGELSSPPAATSSLKDKLGWLFMWARNRSTQSATQRKLYADDATTIVSTETVGDDGATFTKGEAS
jgi:hypothetical protein